MRGFARNAPPGLADHDGDHIVSSCVIPGQITSPCAANERGVRMNRLGYFGRSLPALYFRFDWRSRRRR